MQELHIPSISTLAAICDDFWHSSVKVLQYSTSDLLLPMDGLMVCQISLRQGKYQFGRALLFDRQEESASGKYGLAVLSSCTSGVSASWYSVPTTLSALWIFHGI
jgi:hypothetical protein